jgi:hypothetical protein
MSLHQQARGSEEMPVGQTLPLLGPAEKSYVGLPQELAAMAAAVVPLVGTKTARRDLADPSCRFWKLENWCADWCEIEQAQLGHRRKHCRSPDPAAAVDLDYSLAGAWAARVLAVRHPSLSANLALAEPGVPAGPDHHNSVSSGIGLAV